MWSRDISHFKNCVTTELSTLTKFLFLEYSLQESLSLSLNLRNMIKAVKPFFDFRMISPQVFCMEYFPTECVTAGMSRYRKPRFCGRYWSYSFTCGKNKARGLQILWHDPMNCEITSTITK